jgi:serine/threonine protein kinase
VDYAKVQAELLRRGLSETEFCDSSSISPKTLASIRRGGGVRPSSLLQIANFFSLDPNDLLVKGHLGDSARGRLPEWNMVEPQGDWHKASSGLEFRVWKLEHASLAGTFGRGKCYRLHCLADREQERLKKVLLRHPQVCRKFRGQPHIPINLNVFPEQDGRTWWAVDEWVEGHSLEEIFKLGPMLQEDLPVVMKQIALGLKVLHQAVIVRRELAPANILVRQNDRSVILTDFEMSKLFDGSATVAGRWLVNPYRAPEVEGNSAIDVKADLYSWARILVHAATGALPTVGSEARSFQQVEVPAPVRELVLRCLGPQQDRPGNVDEVLGVLTGW